ncbi:TIGR00341 family protein [Ferrimonas senticii]|uniref:TIGR00341 family protein n=1 Tax=Ferrimonas senticii TaxID=394566 RepID=UPI00040EAE4D|nr:TIGR00341 family protein [Ferrimonas senticii]
MKYVEIIASASSCGTIDAIANKCKALHCWHGEVADNNNCQYRLLLRDDALQQALDDLQNVLGAQPLARIIVLPVEASLPKDEQANGGGKPNKKDKQAAARESIYEEVAGNADLSRDYLLLVLLSTVVAAIGLIQDNVAVVIGAMVIAPLLGPNLALSLGTALGDKALVKQAVKTLTVGVTLAIGLSMLFGLLWPGPLDSPELLARTDASLDSIALALASGAAAALSITTGLSSTLVGVMVAVALLPPASCIGIMLGSGRLELAAGAALLLAINIVCVNLASKVVFIYKGIDPRTWVEKELAKRAMRRVVLGWLLTLLLLVGLIIVRGV